jgi:hypothetical protein
MWNEYNIDSSANTLKNVDILMLSVPQSKSSIKCSLYVCVYIYIYVCVCVCIYKNVYDYVCMYVSGLFHSLVNPMNLRRSQF